MKTLLTALTIALLAGTVSAAANHDFVLDVTDPNEAFLWNRGDTALTIDGYTILSASGLLDVDAFRGIAVRVDELDGIDVPGQGLMWVIANLGAGALGMGQASPTPLNLSELTTGAGATFQPGFRLSLGNCAPNGSVRDLSFYGSESGVGTFESVVFPEPATMSLLALGALAIARRRRS